MPIEAAKGLVLITLLSRRHETFLDAGCAKIYFETRGKRCGPSMD